MSWKCQRDSIKLSLTCKMAPYNNMITNRRQNLWSCKRKKTKILQVTIQRIQNTSEENYIILFRGNDWVWTIVHDTIDDRNPLTGVKVANKRMEMNGNGYNKDKNEMLGSCFSKY